jgi:hypothetical protein
MAGLKNIAATRRCQDGSKLTEEKLPLPFDETPAAQCLPTAFFTMTWNLMRRSRNTLNVVLEHISFNGDSKLNNFLIVSV